MRFLGIVDDSERWGRLFTAVFMGLLIGLLAAITRLKDLVIAGDEESTVQVYRPGAIIVFAGVLSAVLWVGRMRGDFRMKQLRAALDRDLSELPATYRANAEPRLMASRHMAGWMMHVVLALPAMVAVASVLIIELMR